MMTSKERLLAALDCKVPDRLPVTTHHVLPFYLKNNLKDASIQAFFDQFGFDSILWTQTHIPNENDGQCVDPIQKLNPDGTLNFLDARRIISDDWRYSCEEIPDTRYLTQRYTIHTPSGNLTMVLQSNEWTSWVTEYLIKSKSDIDILAKHMTFPTCDVRAVNRAVDAFGEQGIVRSHIVGFDLFGQGGSWQDACCVVGAERLIMETFDDPAWVHELCGIFMRRKINYARTLKGAKYDVIECGGGDGSTSVVSPTIFNKFVAPYDAKVIEAAHDAGQRIAYHLCGKVMNILEDALAMKPDAIETFTPGDMGGDADLAKAKKIINGKVCMIGGFDQGHHLIGCTEAKTREQVRRCFNEAGENGGFILAPSDHFFDADPTLLLAMVEEAKKCVY